jgi:histidine ammonia-lyase
VELRAPLRTSPLLLQALAVIRRAVPPLEEDRILAPDLQAAAALVATGALADAIPMGILPELASEHGRG